MPALRNVVSVPAMELQFHPAFVAMLKETGAGPAWLEFYVVRVMMGMALYCPSGDMDLVSDYMLAQWTGADEKFIASFRRHFVVDGKFELFTQLNSSRLRHREKCRVRMQKVRSEEKAVTAPPKRRAPKASMEAFDKAWALYPKRSGGNPKTLAEKAWKSRIKDGVPEDELVLAASNYAEVCRREGREGTVYVMQGSTFFGPNERWKDFLDIKTIKPEEKSDLDDVLAEVARAYGTSD